MSRTKKINLGLECQYHGVDKDSGLGSAGTHSREGEDSEI